MKYKFTEKQKILIGFYRLSNDALKNADRWNIVLSSDSTATINSSLLQVLSAFIASSSLVQFNKSSLEAPAKWENIQK